MSNYIEDIKRFKEHHSNCKFYIVHIIGDEYLFTCQDFLNINHIIQKIAVVMPHGCRYPSLDCAISGYCKRDIACNH